MWLPGARKEQDVGIHTTRVCAGKRTLMSSFHGDTAGGGFCGTYIKPDAAYVSVRNETKESLRPYPGGAPLSHTVVSQLSPAG